MSAIKPVGLTEPAAMWDELARLTPARIGLGRSGVSLPTREVLGFGLAHARARDAVHAELDVPRLHAELQALDWAPVLHVASAAPTRAAYLARPDWGRRLDESSRHALEQQPAMPADLVLVISDGLSALAVHAHAALLLRAMQPRLCSQRLAALVIATQARVALADEVGASLRARVAVSLIGERPGLSAPDSLGVYITAQPRVGCTDAQRWCVSNIHASGLDYDAAAMQVCARIDDALTLGCSGVAALSPPGG